MLDGVGLAVVERDRRRALTGDDVANHNTDVALAMLSGMRLRSLTPSPVEQQPDSGDARTLARAVLGDAGEHAQAHRGV